MAAVVEASFSQSLHAAQRRGTLGSSISELRKELSPVVVGQQEQCHKDVILVHAIESTPRLPG